MILKPKMTVMNKKVLIGLTGSIAAYKTAELIRFFKKAGAEVKVAATEAALLFIGEKTLETLSNNPVYVDMFQKRCETKHISLADWADIFVIAPISANSISKIANGVADNLLTSISCAYLGKNKPFFIAPAMNEGMWENVFVKENIEKLKKAGVKVIEPIEGLLACGYEGKGKMEEPEKIFNAVFSPQNRKEKIVITSGGTREYIDPVRFITNASSGKMGSALADCAYNLGYEVVLITTVDVNKPYKTLNVNTADEMFEAVNKEFSDAKYLIMAAAVSDFKIKNYKNSKIRKNDIKNDTYNIELSLNPDILKCIAQNKKEGQKIIGFSLATENVVEIGKEKLIEKGCDYIVANEAKTALNKDTNEVWVIEKTGKITKIDNAKKDEIAKSILEIVL